MADSRRRSHPAWGAWIKIRACCQIASISMGGRRNLGGRSSRLPPKRFLTSNRSLPPKGRSTSKMCRLSASIRRWGSRRTAEHGRTSGVDDRRDVFKADVRAVPQNADGRAGRAISSFIYETKRGCRGQLFEDNSSGAAL